MLSSCASARVRREASTLRVPCGPLKRTAAGKLLKKASRRRGQRARRPSSAFRRAVAREVLLGRSDELQCGLRWPRRQAHTLVQKPQVSAQAHKRSSAHLRRGPERSVALMSLEEG